MASQKQNAAATRIQARVRGLQSRRQQRRVVAGVTKLQALQRGRFSRREFTRLLEFSREQESFLHATKRRQLRIWRHEQELYFLQHTTAVQLERIREFQRRRGANLIKRIWRASRSPSIAASESRHLKCDHPRDRIFAFDPFQLGYLVSSSKSFLKFEERGEIGTRVSPQSVEKDLLGPPAPRGSSVALDRDKLQQRRRDLLNRIKQRVQMQTQKDKLTALHSGSLSHQQGSSGAARQPRDLLSPTKKQANRRRELYDQLVHLRKTTTRRVYTCEAQYLSTRASRELLSAQLTSSCANRLALLQQQSHELSVLLSSLDKTTVQQPTLESNNFQEQITRLQTETQSWSSERQTRAWQSHSQCVQAVQSKRFWWQTTLAGAQADIRKVHAASPWETNRKVWLWPAPRQEKVSQDPTTSHRPGLGHSSDVDTFLFSITQSEDDDATDTKCPQPLDDREASEWWRAHCVQPHLVQSESGNNQHVSSNNNSKAADEFHDRLWSSEALANPVVHRLHRQSQRQSLLKEHKLAVSTATDRFQKHVNQRVGELEMQIELNTKLQQDMALRRQQIRKRRSREENAVVTVQRVFRGLQGRQRAQEVRAEFFVMVRGRAIRKGKCEECGEQQAVLECHECEESLHFCPLCWVQVHGTRRRRLHVAIPMSVSLNAARRVGVNDGSPAPIISTASEPKSKTTTISRTSESKSKTPRSKSVSEARKTGVGGEALGVERPRLPGRKVPILQTSHASNAKPVVVDTNEVLVEKQPIKKAVEVVTSLLAKDESDNMFASPIENGGGDNSCPPVLEKHETAETEPQMVISDPTKPSAPVAKQPRITSTKAASRVGSVTLTTTPDSADLASDTGATIAVSTTAVLQQVGIETEAVVSCEPVNPQSSPDAAEDPKHSQAEDQELETKAPTPQPKAEAETAPPAIDEASPPPVVQPHEGEA